MRTVNIGGRVPATCAGEAAVAHRADAVPPVRRALRARLIAAGVPVPAREDAELVAAELLGNAIRHARPVEGAVLREGSVLLEVAVSPDAVVLRVTDGGSEQDLTVPAPSATRRGGRGLRIVARLCADWGVVDHDDGRRTVWGSVPVLRG